MLLLKLGKSGYPPIKIIMPDNWQMLLISNNARSEMKGWYLSIKFNMVDDYHNVLNFLVQQNNEFQSYILEDAKPFKVVLISLYFNTGVQDIRNVTENEDFLMW